MLDKKMILNIHIDDDLIDGLDKIFEENKDKRICVVATSCAGKSTLLKFFEDAKDMDEELFPLLTKE